jgi:hypothetical protein
MILLPIAEGGAKNFGVFRVKNHDYTPKNHIFSNFRGGRAPGAPPPPGSAPALLYLSLVFFLKKSLNKSWFLTWNTPKIFAPPSAIGNNIIFWRKIVIFHTKYPKIFRAFLHSAQLFLSAPHLTWNPGSAPELVGFIFGLTSGYSLWVLWNNGHSWRLVIRRALKKIAASGGRREIFWDISCEKSRFYAKKLYCFQLRREARTFFEIIPVFFYSFCRNLT